VSRSTRKCYTIYSGPDRGVHIPGCMGCAVFGHYACTCSGRAGRGSLVADGDGCIDEDAHFELIERLADLERRVEKLEGARHAKAVVT